MKKFDDFLFESVYGNYATVFHRTSVENLINKIYTEGYKPLHGMYGMGFYGTYELESQLNDIMKASYGNIIVKFAVPIDDYLILDYDAFVKSPMAKKIKDWDKFNFRFKQLEYFHYDSNELFNPTELSALVDATVFDDMVLKDIMYDLGRTFQKGAIFTIRGQGKVLLCYEPNKSIMPLSYSTDEGKTFVKVPKNMEYLRTVLMNKTETPNELQRSIESYFTINGKWSINLNGDIDVDGDVKLKLKCPELPVKFGIVTGSFDCSFKGLTTLVGSPEEVGDFDCSYNILKNLFGAPKIVNGSFVCNANSLEDLSYCPEIIKGHMNCKDNMALTSLKGISKHITSLDCSFNRSLKSLIGLKSNKMVFLNASNAKLETLEGSPQTVDFFNVSNNVLQSLEGGPKFVKHEYDCQHNYLKNLNGAPVKNKSLTFVCSDNRLTSLDGCPSVLYILHCDGNDLQTFDGLDLTVHKLVVVDSQKNADLIKKIVKGNYKIDVLWA